MNWQGCILHHGYIAYLDPLQKSHPAVTIAAWIR